MTKNSNLGLVFLGERLRTSRSVAQYVDYKILHQNNNPSVLVFQRRTAKEILRFKQEQDTLNQTLISRTIDDIDLPVSSLVAVRGN